MTISPPQRRRRRKPNTILLSIIGVVALGLAEAACGGASTSTVHGTVSPTGPGSALGMGGDATSFADCSLDSPMPGDQITVTDPSGKVIGNATLGVWSAASVRVQGLTVYPCFMSFTMKQVPSEQRYGFAISGVPGKTWINNAGKTVTLAVNSG